MKIEAKTEKKQIMEIENKDTGKLVEVENKFLILRGFYYG